MNPLSCLHPQWKPVGSTAVLWRKTQFQVLDDAKPEWKEHAKSVVQWVCDSARTIVSVDEGQLTWSCWAPWLEAGTEDTLREMVRRTFISDQRPTWTWRKGGDVALQGWEREQTLPRSATSSPGPTRPKPDPVFAWHLKEWE